MKHSFGLIGAIFTIWLLAACSQPASDSNAHYDFQPGFIPFAVDEKGKLFLKIENFDQELLYMYSLPQGLGSNDIGLDRGQMMGLQPALVRFELIGDKVLLRQINTQYRAVSDNAMERKAVEDAFASSVLWGFKVVGREGNAAIVDATDFVLRDSHGVGRKLKQQKQGNFKVDLSRSAIYLPRTKTFPKNTELEATITFTGTEPGNFVQQVAPDPYSFSLRMHHSFIELPDDNYQPRAFHPESGFWAFSYQDYATDIEKPLTQRFIPRHRLEKKNPQAEKSEAVNPIIYYLDPGTPEPVRSALLDGARWWNQAFESAGYIDGFQVKMLPEDADPMDVRYNVIQWVHRATRGWSYGYGVSDPRTGEIIKGHVTLGSLRVRQDYLIAQGMTSPFEKEITDTTPMTEMALARIRQLSAHEIGHTLGIAHNFAASVKDRASVMDYPHPRISLKNGKVSLEGAYATDIGSWDKRVIQYGYGTFSSELNNQENQENQESQDDSNALLAHINENHKLGFQFISDPDSRSYKDMHPASSLWENGSEPVAELNRLIELRSHALKNFDESAIPFGEVYSTLEEVLVPVYYYHRFQTQAVGKMIGGVNFSYGVKTKSVKTKGVKTQGVKTKETPFNVTAVNGKDQWRAVEALVKTLTPEFLTLNETILSLIPPKAYGYQKTRESTQGFTGSLLDPVSMAEASVRATLDIIYHPERLARLVNQHARDTGIPTIGQINDKLFGDLVEKRVDGLQRAVHQRTVSLLFDKWLNTLANKTTSPESKVEMYRVIEMTKRWLTKQVQNRSIHPYKDFYAWQLKKLESFNPGFDWSKPEKGKTMPPGSPIGAH